VDAITSMGQDKRC